jgi:hypothetical protein
MQRQQVDCVGLRSVRNIFQILTVGAAAVLVAVAAFGESPASPQTATVGNPLAPRLMPLIVQEMRDGFRQRGVEGQFNQWCAYVRSRLDSTAGELHTSEITGNCRLAWFDRMMRNPYLYPAEAELFTRQLHQALSGDYRGFDLALRIARSKMDLGNREIRPMTQPTSPEQALEIVKQALTEAQAGYAAAAGSIPRGELEELRENLYPITTSQNREGHTLVDRSTGRRLCDIMEKMDRTGFYRAAEAMVPLLSEELLKQLAAIPEEGPGGERVAGATGTIIKKIVTPSGTIVIGGKGKNTYELDKMRDVNVVIDLGGDDVYMEGTTTAQRPVLIIIDLAGNDRYEATRPGVQGGAVVGVSMLIDVSGNDVYRAQDVAQGSALCGVGILVDMAGNDQYIGVRRVQGHAFGGLGILLDRAGNDRYHAAMWAQGFGAPMGFGVLDDLEGKDHYYCGGLYLDSYPETPGYEGWGQGVGAGLRQVACGGIGVILDGGGDDVYEYDYISHGGGYWLGMGFARDFGGNDRRFGGTQKNYYGGQRTEEMFQRFGCGFGCHLALGSCIDDQGNDTYGGTIMGLGMGWDLGFGLLCDFGGSDRYDATGGLTQGNGAQASIGVLFDYTGNDVYDGYNQGYASPGISYHRMPQCGGNFSFLIDYGGNDSYGCGVENNTYNERGSDTGFLIDRPLPSEAAKTARKPKASGETASGETASGETASGETSSDETSSDETATGRDALTDGQAEAGNRSAAGRQADQENRSPLGRLRGR